MSYTKGPWRWWSKASGRPKKCDVARLMGENGRPILRCYGGGGLEALGVAEENQSNAALIAASPLLLEAMQNMLGAFDNPIVRRKYRDEFTDAAIASARDAIEAATQTKNEEVE